MTGALPHSQPPARRALTRRLPASALSPAAARSFIRTSCVGLATETRDAAELLVSELVTNAVRHADSSLVLAVDLLGGGGVRVTVSDASPAFPQPREAGLDADDGRGLLLVGALATAWGWEAVGGGKDVWFELSR